VVKTSLCGEEERLNSGCRNSGCRNSDLYPSVMISGWLFHIRTLRTGYKINVTSSTTADGMADRGIATADNFLRTYRLFCQFYMGVGFHYWRMFPFRGWADLDPRLVQNSSPLTVA